MLSMIQMLWDRAESNGYAQHMTDDPYPNTPPHEVLLSMAYGDHQVAPVTADVIPHDRGRVSSTRVHNVSGTAQLPSSGSASSFDSGPVARAAARRRRRPTPPSIGQDPHEFPRRTQ